MLEEYICVYIALNLKLYRDIMNVWIYNAAIRLRSMLSCIFVPHWTALEALFPLSSHSADKTRQSHSQFVSVIN